MIEFDYAFIADFAKVEANGTLTAVGASWTFVRVARLPASHRMAVAGRVRAPVDVASIPFRIEVIAPENTFRMGLAGELKRAPDARPYGPDLKVGHLFALDMDLALPTAGLYEVHLYVGDEHVRRLAFDVVEDATPLR